MNRPGVPVLEPRILGAGALLEDAARDLEASSTEMLSRGHSPSWGSPQVPDGLALCVGCWQLITARQLGRERCSSPEREPKRDVGPGRRAPHLPARAGRPG